jgi:hypothetical protein
LVLRLLVDVITNDDWRYRAAAADLIIISRLGGGSLGSLGGGGGGGGVVGVKGEGGGGDAKARSAFWADGGEGEGAWWITSRAAPIGAAS